MSPRAGLDIHIILNKAAALIDEQGLEQLSLGALAKALHIRTPSLYNHIAGLANLRVMLAVHGIRRLYNEMLHASAGRSGDEAVRSLSSAYVNFARSHPGLYDATFRSPNPGDGELNQAQHEIVSLVLQVLEGYGLQGDEGLHRVRGLRSLLHGFASIEQMGGFGLPLETDKSLHILLDTYIAGLRAAGQRGDDGISL